MDQPGKEQPALVGSHAVVEEDDLCSVSSVDSEEELTLNGRTNFAVTGSCRGMCCANNEWVCGLRAREQRRR